MATRKTSSAKKVSTRNAEELKEENEFKPSMVPLAREMISDEELEFESLMPTLEPTYTMGIEVGSELLAPTLEPTYTMGIEVGSELLAPTLEPTDIMGMEMVSEEQLLGPDIELTKSITEASEFHPLPISEVESWNQDVEASSMKLDIENDGYMLRVAYQATLKGHLR